MKGDWTIRACSYEDGIEFFLKKKTGYSSRARLLQNGNIEVNTERSEHSFLNREKNSIKDHIFTIIMAIIITVIINFVTPVLLKHILIILSIWTFIGLYFYMNDLNPSIKKFHGAEHKVLNAYNALDRLPTMDEALKYSRFYIACGCTISSVILSIVTAVYVSIVIFDNIVIIILSILIMLYFILKLWAKGKLNIFQLFTTAEPTNVEIKVALEGLKWWLKEEGLD